MPKRSDDIPNRPFFSVIMPTYGVERHIADAVADILVQTFGDFELIVVDDCSPDRSGEIARAVAHGDPRVRIVRHDENRGLSAARNTGIDEARGTWALFPDPDDRYDDNLLACVRKAVSRPVADVGNPGPCPAADPDDPAAANSDPCGTPIGQNRPDLVVFGHVQEYYDAQGTHLYDNSIDLADASYLRGPQLGHAVVELERQTHLGYAWNKAYRLERIRDAGLRFEDDAPLIEDVLFNIAYLRQTDAAITLSYAPYRYAKRLGTNLTNEFVPRYFELHRRRIEEIRDFAEEYGALDDGARATLGALYARFIFSTLEQNTDARAGLDHAGRVAWLRELFDDALFNELIDDARAQDSLALAICLKLLRARDVFALLALGRAIHVVRTRSATLYTKVKSRR